MIVDLLTKTEFITDMEHNAALAALTCHANTDKPFVPSEVLKRIIKAGHESILEHITLTYSVKKLSRACLQELARHRHISLSVESTRHTLKEKIDGKAIDIAPPEKLVGIKLGMTSFNGDKRESFSPPEIMTGIIMYIVKEFPEISNDELKYLIPELFTTNLILTTNVRELRHIVKLRTAPAALNEFRVLAYSLFDVMPEQFKYLVEDCVYKEEKGEN